MSILRISRNVSRMLDKPVDEVRPIVEAVFADMKGDFVDKTPVIIPGFGRFTPSVTGRVDFSFYRK